MACDDYSLKNIIVFFFLQRDVRTIIKLKLEQASKEYQKEFHRKKNKKTRKASQNGFLRSYRDITKFAMI